MPEVKEKPDEPTPFEVFTDFVRKILAVPKAEIDAAEQAEHSARAKAVAKRKKRRNSR